MQIIGENIYKMARNTTPYSREYAAPLVGISKESLKDYETDVRKTPNDVVLSMIKTYGTPWLALKHLEYNEIAREYLPKIELKDLPNAILTLQKELNDVIPLIPSLIDVGYDGKIKPDERGLFDRVCKEGLELAGALIALNLAKTEE